MATELPILRQEQITAVQRLVADGNCVAIHGLSNTGKSPFLRALALPENQQRFKEIVGRPAAMIYVECNRVVEVSATGFYEFVIRSLIEFIEDPNTPPEPSAELMTQLREYHNRITTGPAFQASLAFNNALADTCSRLDLTLHPLRIKAIAATADRYREFVHRIHLRRFRHRRQAITRGLLRRIVAVTGGAWWRTARDAEAG